MEFHLLFHNIISIGSAVVALGAALFTYLNGRHQTANITFSLVFLGASIFALSHVIGVNINDPELSKFVLMFNDALFLLSAVTVHAILSITEQDKEKMWLIKLTYVVAFGLAIFFVIFPDLFLLPSKPKMYFPNYYEPGLLNISRVLFMYAFAAPYSVLILYKAIKKTSNKLVRNRYKYLLLCLMAGYGIGFIPNLLVYDIPVDPLWGMGFAIIIAIPFVYGALKYEILSIRVIAAQAFLYSLAVAIVGSLIVALFYLIESLENIFPDFPVWAAPFVSAVLVVTASVLVWRRLREADLLKYEFINTVTHKFRTPLTRIKWATEELMESNLPQEQLTTLARIKNDDEKLVELTRTLLKVSPTENTFSEYRLERASLSKIAEEAAKNILAPAESKQIRVIQKIEPDVFVMCDPSRIKFVAQVLAENAVNYTPANGVVTILVEKDNNKALYSVEDNGIGIAKEELPLIFSKFYRSKEAKGVDVEGLGIGLHVAKGIIENHHGKISAHSGGTGLGSTFFFSLAAVK